MSIILLHVIILLHAYYKAPIHKTLPCAFCRCDLYFCFCFSLFWKKVWPSHFSALSYATVMGLYVNQCQTSARGNFFILRGIWKILENNILPLKVLTINKMPSTSKKIAPAKHSSGKCDRNVWQTARRTDRQTDGQTTDKVIPMCRYASQATQKLIFWYWHCQIRSNK